MRLRTSFITFLIAFPACKQAMNSSCSSLLGLIVTRFREPPHPPTHRSQTTPPQEPFIGKARASAGSFCVGTSVETLPERQLTRRRGTRIRTRHNSQRFSETRSCSVQIQRTSTGIGTRLWGTKSPKPRSLSLNIHQINPVLHLSFRRHRN